MAHTLVTVVVPTYNGSRFIDATLDSIADQDHDGIECIVVDDGSTDDTVLRARAHRVGARVVQQEHGGVAVARNRGMALALGRWVGFLDQDDLWHRHRVGTLLGLATETGAKAVATSELPFAYADDRAVLGAVGDGREAWPDAWISRGGERDLTRAAPVGATGVVSHLTLSRLREGAAMLTTNVLYDRETAIAAGGCAPHARALDDHILNLNVARIAGPIVRVDSRQLLYRVHSTSTSTVSPMVGPFLSAQAAVRLGGVFPSDAVMGPNVEHLLYGLGRSNLTMREQLGLLLLTVPVGQRFRWYRRWLARRLHLR